VEEALCRRFGTSPEGNWYREGLTSEHHFEQWATWQRDIADRLPQLQYKWDQYNYCDSPSSTWIHGKYTLEDEWFNNKAKDLYPTHPWNVAAAAVSFFCLMVWILLSPHRGESAKRLDVARTLNSPPCRVSRQLVVSDLLRCRVVWQLVVSDLRRVK
jgi:hypothetical protein